VNSAPTPRDAQRSRVYLAELPMPSSPLPGLAACQAYMERVVGSLWWHARFPAHTLDRMPCLRPGNGARRAFYAEDERGTTSITLPRRYRTKGVVLHELAHWAMSADVDLPNHGSTFTRILLDMTAEFIGPERRETLAAAYTEQRARVGAPATADESGQLRYGADERARLASSAARRQTRRATGGSEALRGQAGGFPSHLCR
jgi:putative metallohydrolase (TIGR04338 family)